MIAGEAGTCHNLRKEMSAYASEVISALTIDEAKKTTYYFNELSLTGSKVTRKEGHNLTTYVAGWGSHYSQMIQVSRKIRNKNGDKENG